MMTDKTLLSLKPRWP